MADWCHIGDRSNTSTLRFWVSQSEHLRFEQPFWVVEFAYVGVLRMLVEGFSFVQSIWRRSRTKDMPEVCYVRTDIT